MTLVTALVPHRNLPVLVDHFVEGDCGVLVMNWVDGVNLGRLLTDEGVPGLAPSLAVDYLDHVAAVLGAPPRSRPTSDPWRREPSEHDRDGRGLRRAGRLRCSRSVRHAGNDGLCGAGSCRRQPEDRLVRHLRASGNGRHPDHGNRSEGRSGTRRRRSNDSVGYHQRSEGPIGDRSGSATRERSGKR